MANININGESESKNSDMSEQIDKLNINSADQQLESSEHVITECLDSNKGCDFREENGNPESRIKREDVQLPDCFKGKLAFVLYNVFSKEECEDYIRKTEEMGYEEALVNVGYGRQEMMKDVRNNTRCIWDSEEEATRIWDRIKQHIPETWANRKVMGLNERLRFLKYEPGEYFAPHMDGCYMRENGERSYITVQLYLNEGFEGGSTTFMNYGEKQRVEVVPKTGLVLVFQHDIMHEGSKLVKGRKYTVRTDVMYGSAVQKTL